MTVARIARRSLMDRLLLGGIEYTNARPWIGAVGVVAMYVLAGVLEQFT